MSAKHPVIAVTGSSGAGTTTVKNAFEHIFFREKINPLIVEGDSYHRYDRAAMKVAIEEFAAKGKQLQAQKSEPIVVSVATDGKIYLGDEQETTMELAALTPKLQAIAKARGGTDQPIFVRGDKAVPYGTVARVMAQIREAGFRKLSLVTQIETGG